MISALETYTRSIMVGESAGYVGLYVITSITKPFSAGEDAIFSWITTQDDCHLADMVQLSDGRDYCIFWREYVKQSYASALEEHDRYIRLKSKLPKQHGSNDTPTFK